MKKLFKSIKYWLSFGKCKQLLGILLGLIVFLIMFEKNIELWICLVSSISIAIVSIAVIQIYLINNYADEYIEQTEKWRYIPKDEIKGYSENINAIIDLDDELVAFLDKYSSGKKTDYFEKELNKQWKKHGDEFTKKADKILKNMSNYELLLTMASTDEITHIVDIFNYFRPYTIDIDYLIKHPDKANEYYIECTNQQETIINNTINDYVALRLLDLNYFDDIEKFVLSNMSNDELLKMAKSSKFWDEKLYYYGFINNNKK